MLDHYLTNWPSDPSSDEASFALATALIDLEKYEAVIDRSEKYATRFPTSRLLDSFWYMVGYSHFELEQPQAALESCRKVAETTFPVPETGGTRAADNRWEAIYIMGQIYHSLGQAGEAIAEYSKVKERFADAAEAIEFFSRKSIGLDEVTTLAPDSAKEIQLRYRNVQEVEVKMYRIDLMKFGLMQRNLDHITAINLAGIRPHHQETIQLGDGKDYSDRTRELSLPLEQEGAYLLVCRSANLYASGLVLVSPLVLHVQEDAESGRIRVSVKNSTEGGFVSGVHVKVIGSANDDFIAGDTDLRGLFIADDIRGTSTVIAAVDGGQYAFYRGDAVLQPSKLVPALAAPQEVPAEQSAPADAAETWKDTNSLRDNLFNQNSAFQEVQKGNYDNLMNNGRSGIKSKEAF
jgi:tetratricopeptide (TPR) repeat protein